jgi:hypothetical protein
MRLAHRRRDALAPVTVPLAEPAVGVAFGVLASILLPEQRSVTPRRFISAWMCDQSGSVRAADEPASVGGNNRRSRSASSIVSGIGQRRPAMAARRTYSPTAVLPIPVASPTSRRLIPSACVRRSTSRIFLIDTLSAGIGHSLVARETDQLIRLSTGATPKPPSPAVRNHRNAVRLALESVSALRRIPQVGAWSVNRHAKRTPFSG